MSASFELRGNGAGAVDLVRQLNQRLDDTEKQGNEAAKGLGRMKEAAEKLAAQGDKAEQYAQKIRKLAEYVDKGALSQEKAEAAANRFRQQIEKSNPKVQEAAKRQQELAAASERTKDAMRRQGEAMKQSLETPLERYKRSMLEVSRLYRSQSIDDETRIRRTRELRRELEAATRATHQQATAQRAAFGPQALASMKSYLLGFGSAAGGIAALRSEFAALRAEGNRISQAKLDAAGARRVLRTQLALATPEEQAMVLDAANRIPGELKIPSTVTDLTLNDAVSASPDIGRAVKFAEFGLRMTRGTGDTVEIGGALDVANALGTDDPTAAYAFLNAAKQVSRVKEVAKVAKNLPRVVNSVTLAGADPRVGGGLYAGLTVGGADPDSEISRTAAINLIDRANKFFTQNKFKDIAREDRDEFAEQIALLMGNDELAQQFIGSKQFQFRAASRSSVQALLTPGHMARDAYNKFFEVIGDDPAATGKGMIDFINAGKDEAAAETDRVIKSGSELRRLGASDTLSEERVIDLVETIRAARLARNNSFSNPAAWTTTIRGNLATAAGPTVERDEAAGLLEAEAAGLRERAEFLQGSRAARWGSPGELQRIQQQLPILQDMANSLRNIDRKANAPTSQQE